MTIQRLLKMGDPRLNQVSSLVVQFDTPELHQLIDDMRDIMVANNGAGLAAPQIGIDAQVVIFSMQNNPRYPDQEDIVETVLINPVIEVLNEQTAGLWEGCLSLPGLRGYVERPSEVRYTGFDQFGNKIDRSVSGFHAVVVQHECDHLQGILYPARITDFTKFGFEETLAEHSDYGS